MNEATRAALSGGGLIDITTTGRQTGEPRRIEIAFHSIRGRLFISGMPSPRKRSWISNLEADPRFTFHLKGAVRADLRARARLITDEAERRSILPAVARGWNRPLEPMVAQSPLVEVTIEESTPESEPGTEGSAEVA